MNETQINPLDAVVLIESTSCRPDFFQPWQNYAQRRGSGSGVVIGFNGLKILTNAHNIADATFITVKKDTGDQPYLAKVAQVNHDCDLALLEVEDKSFFNMIEPLEIGKTPEPQTEVWAIGFPMGGQGKSTTRGIISRIEERSYAHSHKYLLSVQLDAAINPGNSGGPVLDADYQIVGIAFQGLNNGDGLGYMIPTEIIKHFLKDISDGVVDGFGDLSFDFDFLENPAARKYLKMDASMSGIKISKVKSNANNLLEINDVILAIDGKSISNNGFIKLPNGRSVFFISFWNDKQIGENIHLTVLRNGEIKSIVVVNNKLSMLIKPYQYDKRPNYFIFSGFIFSELSLSFFDEFGKNSPPDELLNLWGKEADSADEMAIVSTRVLPDAVNIGYQHLEARLLTAVNGQKPKNIKHLIELIENCNEEFLLFTFGENDVAILERQMAIQANQYILERYHIPADRYLTEK